MKKAIVLTTLLLLAAAPAFAASSGDVSGEGITIMSGTETIAKLSAGVAATINFDATSYALATKATKGTMIYATAANDTSIWAKAGTAGSTITNTDLGTESDSSVFDGGTWTEM